MEQNMKSKLTFFMLVLSVFVFAQSQEPELPPLPWHTVNITWIFQKPTTEVERLDMDISIDRDITQDYFLYISPFNSTFNNIQFYAGLQTNISGWKSKADFTYSIVGKGGIFSRWSASPELPIGLEYIEMLSDGLCESASYEGNFCSVRRPFVWSKGAYTLSLIKNETVIFKNSPHIWVSFEITDKSKNETFEIGRLLFEGNKLEIKQDIGAFVEIYNGELSEKSIPEVNITFGCPIINNSETPLFQVYAKQTISNILSATPNITYLTSEKNDITVHLTPQIREQTKNDIIQIIFLEKIKPQ
jgi:hypothetical protein